MEQLSKVFLQMVDMSYQAGIAVLFVLTARVILSTIHAPKKYSSTLWLLPFVRLALPVQIQSIFSLLPKQSSPGTVLAEYVSEPVRYVSGQTVIRSEMPVMPAVDVPGAANVPHFSWMGILAVIWLAGILLLGAFGLFSLWRLKRKLRMSIRLKGNIYLTDGLPSAFVLGIFKPRIYLPSDIAEGTKAYVIAHEKAHIKRKDHISKLVVYCLLCIYWFNPVLWIGYYFFRKDVELACDEAVIANQDEEYRRNYAEALLKLSAPGKNFQGIPLAFAEESPKERIEKVIEYKKPKLAAAVMGVLLLAVLAIGLLTNPVKEGQESEAADRIENLGDTVEAIALEADLSGEESEPEKKLTEEEEIPESQETNLEIAHRSGFQTPRLHYYTPRRASYAYAVKSMEEEAQLTERAQNALEELYALTGYQAEECYYFYIDSTDTFCFGVTQDDLERDRTFFTRNYGNIPSMDLTSRRRIWYSPVDMMIYPEGYETMTEKEKAVWFTTHSGMYNGQPVADAYQPYDWDLNVWHVVMEDDTTYEITLDSEADTVGSIYGPYPTSDIQH